MPPVSAAAAVEIWERGADRSLAQRAALLAGIALAHLPPARLERTAIGRRDCAILALREETLGSRLACFVECAACKTRLEFGFDADALAESDCAIDLDAESYDLEAATWRVRYRLPTGADIAEIAARADGDAARRAVLERCILAVTGPDAAGGAVRAPAFDEIPAPVLDALESALEARDPLAKASFSTVCAACGHASVFYFDVVAYFCAELFAIAKRLLYEVDVLARTYHWREADVLALSAVRRRAYVESALG
jgi:hypothetical protein